MFVTVSCTKLKRILICLKFDTDQLAWLVLVWLLVQVSFDMDEYLGSVWLEPRDLQIEHYKITFGTHLAASQLRNCFYRSAKKMGGSATTGLLNKHWHWGRVVPPSLSKQIKHRDCCLMVEGYLCKAVVFQIRLLGPFSSMITPNTWVSKAREVWDVMIR